MAKTKTTASATPAVSSSTEVQKTPKEPKTPKPVKEDTPVTVVAAAPAAVSESSHEDSQPQSGISSQFSSISSKLQQFISFASSLRGELRLLERQAVKELRSAQKASAKKRRKVGNRAPSGFVKPTPISKELAEFLGKSDGHEMARTEVTREINAYIRNNNLQDKENGRRINPDAKLKSLLKLKKGEDLTYFNLQRYMSPHFSVAAKATATA
ncbi:MAG: hypothetical protein FJX80_02230 [Bacteroidetes bacterium]|nr:hypothetical protein [Bacteroidota bacterium]